MRPRKKDRHLPPCVYLRHGTYWHVQAGQWTNLGRDKGAALTEYAKRVSAPKGGMAALIDDVLAKQRAGLAESTKAQYRYAAAILKRKLVEFAPEQVKSRHVAAIVDSMAHHPNMANRALSFLRIVFAYAVRHQMVDSNPCIGVARLFEAKRKRLLTDAEWRSIYEKAGPRLRVIMRLQLLTGQRIGDVLRIRRSQLGEAGIEFEQQKTKARLVVKWSPDLRSAVQEAVALLGGAPTLTLFRSTTGGAPNYRSVHEQFARAAAAGGVDDARPNDQRAQSLTKAKKQGKNPTALAGHTNEAQTESYLRDRESPEVEGPRLGVEFWKIN